jgi:hypothetical protein
MVASRFAVILAALAAGVAQTAFAQEWEPETCVDIILSVLSAVLTRVL